MAITRQQAAKLVEIYKMREDLQSRRERLARDKNTSYSVVIVLDDSTKINTSIPRDYLHERLSQQMSDLDGQILTNGGVP